MVTRPSPGNLLREAGGRGGGGGGVACGGTDRIGAGVDGIGASAKIGFRSCFRFDRVRSASSLDV